MTKFLLLLTITLTLHAEVLDKVLTVINNRVITLSEQQRVANTIKARKEISPVLYWKNKYSKDEIVELLYEQYIIRDKVSSLGYNIDDDSVESRIKQTEERIGIDRKQLLVYLKSNGLSFAEYFEIIRDTIEQNIFLERIIYPLINVEESEILNEYKAITKGKKNVSFNYSLIHIISDKPITQKNFLADINDYRRTKIKAHSLAKADVQSIDDIMESGLNKAILAALSKTDINDVSPAVMLDGKFNYFYIQNKVLNESEEYSQRKIMIHRKIQQEKSAQVASDWLNKEKTNYYILKN